MYVQIHKQQGNLQFSENDINVDELLIPKERRKQLIEMLILDKVRFDPLHILIFRDHV